MKPCVNGTSNANFNQLKQPQSHQHSKNQHLMGLMPPHHILLPLCAHIAILGVQVHICTTDTK